MGCRVSEEDRTAQIDPTVLINLQRQTENVALGAGPKHPTRDTRHPVLRLQREWLATTRS